MTQINVAFQILPRAALKKDAYALVDTAIAVIQASGLRYEVCPFETVIEGEYDEVMQVIKKAQDACLMAGAPDLLAYIKIQRSADEDVHIEDKTEKYR